jgi:pimeloyl-ACP methyl ester carboxylesterase
MRIAHARLTLELHEVRQAAGAPLLLLHALAGSSADWGGGPAWPGAVWALDFSGHGRSEPVAGGAYTAELLAGDADAALAKIGPAAVAGKGLGAYVALLVAGARPDVVRAALLLPGAGLAGGGPAPYLDASPEPLEMTDPAHTFERDVRPPEYAASFARAARRILLVEDGPEPPPWWRAVRPPGETVAATDAFSRLAARARG